MACFSAPAAEAIITTAVTKSLEKSGASDAKKASRLSFVRKLKWLSHMLWGGSILLAFEHVWHGEIVPWFPFLTATADPTSTSEMLREIATTGVAMAGLITAVWAVMVLVSRAIEKRADAPAVEEGA
ncbi:MAG: hypothetical protein ACOYJY_02060 [Acutalibacteraceae bacterium]|jgi:hypothetical protein